MGGVTVWGMGWDRLVFPTRGTAGVSFRVGHLGSGSCVRSGVSEREELWSGDFHVDKDWVRSRSSRVH